MATEGRTVAEVFEANAREVFGDAGLVDPVGVVAPSMPAAVALQDGVEDFEFRDLGESLGRAIFEAVSVVADVPTPGSVALIIILPAGHEGLAVDPTNDWDVDATVQGLDGPAVITFPDGSMRAYPIGSGGLPSADHKRAVTDPLGLVDDASGEVLTRAVALDSVVLLVEPITAEEYGGVERLLGALEEAFREGALDELDEARLRALVDLLASTHRATEVGKSSRARLWATTASVLRFLWVDLPHGALNWAKLLTLLEVMKWLNLNAELLQLLKP